MTVTQLEDTLFSPVRSWEETASWKRGIRASGLPWESSHVSFALLTHSGTRAATPQCTVSIYRINQTWIHDKCSCVFKLEFIFIFTQRVVSYINKKLYKIRSYDYEWTKFKGFSNFNISRMLWVQSWTCLYKGVNWTIITRTAYFFSDMRVQWIEATFSSL